MKDEQVSAAGAAACPRASSQALVLGIGLFGITACGGAQSYWAPQTAESLPPRNVATVEVHEMVRPSCAYRVIGSAFGDSLDVLRTVAAKHGGDGVYETSCNLSSIGQGSFERSFMSCRGRVYVCGPTNAATTEQR
jgi:hypothetical protein